MYSLETAIAANGGMEALQRGEAVRMKRNETCVLIEYIGAGPRSAHALKVSEYDARNGGIIRRPEMDFEIVNGNWLPFYYRDDHAGEEIQIYTVYGNGRLLGINTEKFAELIKRARAWDRRIYERGLVAQEAASLYFPLFAEG